MAGYFLTNRRELEIPELDKPIKPTFPDPDPMRFPGALISASNISFTYPGSAKRRYFNYPPWSANGISWPKRRG
jgi:hypothetical protein